VIHAPDIVFDGTIKNNEYFDLSAIILGHNNHMERSKTTNENLGKKEHSFIIVFRIVKIKHEISF
jgi:hypothetical protein